MYSIIKRDVYENGKQYYIKDVHKAIKTDASSIKVETVEKLAKFTSEWLMKAVEHQGAHVN